ncbi:MAG TPA: hypothetical protein VMS56_05420 [Thermoanaerobaculia bacterium]|nr:hypothetical protein [Thermoanaerobaculia bacterium]
MRRLTTTLLLLVLASIIPIAVVAAVCGPETPCCRKQDAAEPVLARPDCCSAPCVDTPRETREPGDAAKQIRLDRPELARNAEIGPSIVPPSPSPVTDEAPLPAPDLDRRLASLSLLLI